VYAFYLYIDENGWYTNSGDQYDSYTFDEGDMENYGPDKPLEIDEWFTSSETHLLRPLLPPKAFAWVEQLPEYEIQDEREKENAKLVR
jgi:hypothetical protein